MVLDILACFRGMFRRREKLGEGKQTPLPRLSWWVCPSPEEDLALFPVFPPPLSYLVFYFILLFVCFVFVCFGCKLCSLPFYLCIYLFIYLLRLLTFSRYFISSFIHSFIHLFINSFLRFFIHLFYDLNPCHCVFSMIFH